MLFTEKRVVLLVGGYGSGKTEIAVNYALRSKQERARMFVVDLDIVNPYFRSREQEQLMRQAGVEVVQPAAPFFTADLPAIPPQVKGVLQDENCQVVVDMGGDYVGARVLGSYGQAILAESYEMWYVCNAYRPFLQQAAGNIALLRAIEAASRLQVTGLINNTHLMQFTDLEIVQRGEAVGVSSRQNAGVAFVFNAIASDWWTQLRQD